jgi:small basic protein
MMMEISISLYIQQFNPTVAVPVFFQYLEYSVLELLAMVFGGKVRCRLQRFLEDQLFFQPEIRFPTSNPESTSPYNLDKLEDLKH